MWTHQFLEGRHALLLFLRVLLELQVHGVVVGPGLAVVGGQGGLLGAGRGVGGVQLGGEYLVLGGSGGHDAAQAELPPDPLLQLLLHRPGAGGCLLVLGALGGGDIVIVIFVIIMVTHRSIRSERIGPVNHTFLETCSARTLLIMSMRVFVIVRVWAAGEMGAKYLRVGGMKRQEQTEFDLGE